MCKSQKDIVKKVTVINSNDTVKWLEEGDTGANKGTKIEVGFSESWPDSQPSSLPLPWCHCPPSLLFTVALFPISCPSLLTEALTKVPYLAYAPRPRSAKCSCICTFLNGDGLITCLKALLDRDLHSRARPIFIVESAGRRRRHFSPSHILDGKRMGKRSRESAGLVSASEDWLVHLPGSWLTLRGG